MKSFTTTLVQHEIKNSDQSLLDPRVHWEALCVDCSAS